MARRAEHGRSDLALFGPASIAVGVFSFAYHASYTWALQFLDFVGMFLFCFTVIARNASRLGWIEPRRELRFFVLGVARRERARTAAVRARHRDPAHRRRLHRRRARPGGRAAAPRAGVAFPRAYVLGLALFAAAALCSGLDLTRVACDPQNHWLQGHAVWHVLTALALLAFFRFYASLPAARARGRA